MDLPLPCTYDFEVTGSKYLHALREGAVPLALLFSGTVFTRGTTGFGVEQVPWDCEASYALPVAVWQQLIDLNYPEHGLAAAGPRRARRPGALPGRARAHDLGRDHPVPARRRQRAQSAQGSRSMSLDQARAVADAVLYEGYLLYPYRATSAKNQSRWQFGVLGPPGAAADGLGEERSMSAAVPAPRPVRACRTGDGHAASAVPAAPAAEPRAGRTQRAPSSPVPELTVDGQLMFSWDEAVEHEVVLPTWPAPTWRPGRAGRSRVERRRGRRAASGAVERRRWAGSAGVAPRCRPRSAAATTPRSADYLRLTRQRRQHCAADERRPRTTPSAGR